MKLFIAFLLLLPAMVATAQKKANPQTYAKTITPADLQRHLHIVAGREMQGRRTATEGQRKAAAYIEQQFRALGLQPGNNGSYQMPFPVYRDETVKSIFTINEKEYKLNDDFQPYYLGNSNISQYFSEVVFAGHGIADSSFDDYKDLNVIGKLVMVMDGVPSSYKGTPVNVRTKLFNAQKRGAAAILVVAGNFPRRQSRGRDMYKDLYAPTQYLNTYYISEKAAQAITGIDWPNIKEDVKSEKLVPKVYAANIHLEMEKKVMKMESTNVLGVLEGADLKDEYVFITAHYDHIGMVNDTTINYGADDDGSGTVGVIELAEAFAKAKAEGRGPRRSIVFMTVSGEEEGLWGSEYYANNPIFPLEKTTVDLNIDMIGRIGSEYLKDRDSVNYVYIIGDDKISTDLAVITDQVNKKNLKMKLDRKYNDPKDPNRFYYRSDHYNFAEKGVPIIFYFNGVHADYHRPTDTPDKINYNLLAKRSQLIFYTAWEMANRNEMLKRDLKLEVPPRGF